ncbi:MAG: DUF389 domain-containing protein [Cyanobacteriota bacterium]|nr:DUF389 domain-containing protein [Cyanobacteriota bacterium]
MPSDHPPPDPLGIPAKVQPADGSRLAADLLEESRPSLNYLMLIISSCVIATLGLLANSTAVIIGAMIVAPLMLPIRGVALGALTGNVVLFRTALFSLLVGTGCGIGLSWLLGRWVDLPSWTSEILARTQPNLLDLGVALAAGAIGAFARVRTQIADSLAGVAIAVALMPPVCVIGLGLSQLDGPVSQGATLLFLTNLLGIALACMVVFWAMGYANLQKARFPLLWMAGLVGVLLLPLGASLSRLLTQAHLETALRRNLLRGTVTFQRVQLLNTEFNWRTSPPEVLLSVRANEPITPRQVQLLEEYVLSQLSQAFTLVLQVSQTQEVRSQDVVSPSPSPSLLPFLPRSPQPPSSLPSDLPAIPPAVSPEPSPASELNTSPDPLAPDPLAPLEPNLLNPTPSPAISETDPSLPSNHGIPD